MAVRFLSKENDCLTDPPGPSVRLMTLILPKSQLYCNINIVVPVKLLERQKAQREGRRISQILPVVQVKVQLAQDL
jgi:hypothetical protein